MSFFSGLGELNMTNFGFAKVSIISLTATTPNLATSATTNYSLVF